MNDLIKVCTEEQRRFCEEYGFPMFVPEDGFCYRCGRMFYTEDPKSHGITKEEAGMRLITACPWCGTSYTE